MRALVGLLLFALGLWALIADLEAWNTVWYLPAWYGYLLILDAVISLRGGRSFVVERRGELVSMMAWSLPFWLLFEALNLRLANWYYVFGLRTLWGSLLMSTLAFATVLPACFFHAEALDAFGAFRDKRWRPLRVTPAVLRLCAAVGAAAVVLPLLRPREFFWMVWAAPLGLLEVVNYRSGAASLLSDLEGGRPGRLLRLLVGGLLAGAAWELLNYWARTKWIYTVPGFEQWKLLEMPFAGFGGFPPLALSAFAFYSFMSPLRGRWRLVAVAVAIAFSAAASAAILDRNVQSVRPVLSDLTGLDASAAAKLRAAGIPTPERLDRVARREGLAAIATRSGIAAGVLERAAGEASLALHKGMGAPAARLLEAAGVRTVADLASADADRLTARLDSIAAARGETAPRPEYVRVWVRAAGPDGRPRR
jgi:predicted flap endonuclease-1-like 5' DNA nuclease